MREYPLRIATKFTDEEKKRMVSRFLDERKRTGIGVERYSAIIGVPRYTFRDWYRDPRFNPEWDVLHPEIGHINSKSASPEEAMLLFERLNEEESISLHEFAGMIGVPYYTVRLWWRTLKRR